MLLLNENKNPKTGRKIRYSVLILDLVPKTSKIINTGINYLTANHGEDEYLHRKHVALEALAYH